MVSLGSPSSKVRFSDAVKFGVLFLELFHPVLFINEDELGLMFRRLFFIVVAVSRDDDEISSVDQKSSGTV